MAPDISERAFEAAIECALLRHGPDACPGDPAAVRESPAAFGDEPAPGGYHRRRVGRLRPRALPDPGRRRRLPPGHAVQGVGEARAAPRRRRQAALPRPPLPRDRPPRRPRRAAQRRQGLGLQVPARVLPTRERPQRRAATLARGQPLRRRPPAPLQRAGRAEPRPRALPERHPHLHRRAQEPAQRPGRPGRHPPVPGGPRPARAALRLRPLPRPLRGRPRAGVRDHQPRRAEDPLPAVQPGTLRRGGEPAGPAHPGRLPHRLPVGGGLGPRQRAGPRPPVHPRGRGRGRPRAEDRRALPHLPALPAARLRAPARAPRARPRRRRALPRPALGRQRQELHHRVARSPALGAARPRRPARLRLGRGGDRPARPRPPAPAQHPAVRADPRGGGEHRPDLASAPRGPRGGPHHHRHHPAEVPGHRRADRRAARPALRGDRGRGALVAVGREHQEPQGGARGRQPGGRRAGGGRRPDPRGGDRRPGPRRDPQPRAPAQPVNVRVHRDPQAQDPGALRPETARRREVRALPPLQHAPGHRGGLHPRRARQLLDLEGLLAPAEDDRGRPALRPGQGRVPAQVVRRAAPARHRREGRHLRRALRRAGRLRHRRAGQGDGGDALAPARGAHQDRARRLPRREGAPVEGARRLLGHREGRRRGLHRVGHELGRAEPRHRRAADGGRVREARLPLPGGREQVPDGVRPAAAAHHVRGQEARRRERCADAVAPEPHPPRQAGRDGARLRQRGRGDPEGLRALLRDHPALGGDRPQPALRGPGPAARLRRVRGRRRRGLRPGVFRPQGEPAQALRGAGAAAPTVRRARCRRGAGLPRSARRLRAPLCLPVSGAAVRRCRPREALRLRAAPAAPAAGGQRRAAARGAAEHRHGVVPHPADQPRPHRARTAGRRARPGRQQAARRRRTRGDGAALAHHRGPERALRPAARPRAPRRPRADSLGPRRRRRPRRQRPGEHARERAADLRPQGRGQDSGDRRDQLRPLQAHHRRPGVRPHPQELPLRRLHPPAPPRRGAAQAAGVEDARVQVEPALEPERGS